MDHALFGDLNEKGFLSPAVELVKAKLKSTHKKNFEDVEAASGVAQYLVMGAGVYQDVPHMVASLILFHKAVRSCQAAILLCERGLVVDAQTLTRSAVESLFHAVALINDPAVFVQMGKYGDTEEKKQAQGMIRSLSELGLNDQNVGDLSEVISRAEGPASKFSAYDAARIAGLMPLYETIYRGLSAVASHATLRSMDSSLDIRDGNAVLLTGPTEYHLDFTLGLLKVCLEVSSTKLREHFIFEESGIE
ncbi:DUF5677 domain-containing protein [Pseudomonas sp. JL3]|uniref:DUF5677 domain-containing protein n=1 Tax=Pseudomonas sp. JL3 TaxID=2919943 RepID=UPI002858E84A|nr:DUF5677 domain-containing protein [Pseudomonas sp. JL3]MDR8364062.1 DUF5677 domain-containing protein [Pseudomonas sp. JL3]